MKTWNTPEVVTLNINATQNQPTAEVACDDFINGVFTFGKRDGSGPKKTIIYKQS